MSAPRWRRKPTGIAAHHHEWMALVDVSGPFLSAAVLSRVFPQGLDDVPTELRARLRMAHEEWRDDQFGLRPDPAIHAAWVRFVFRDLLGGGRRDVAEGAEIPASLRVSLPQHREDLAPTFALCPGRDGAHEGKARLLVQVEPPTQELDKVVPDRAWKASPAARMMALLQGSGVRLGLVTNGAAWTLVQARRGEPTTYVTWSSELFFEEPLTLRAFASLLSLQRFIGVQESETLEALFDESGKNQQEVTEQLGVQTRRAVEVLIQTIDRLDRGRRGVLLKGLSETVLYEAAITVMMRLVFLLAAEDRGLLLKGSALWDQGYAVSTLRDQLQERADRMGEEVLERRHDAWARLCATFRAVHAGIDHEDLRLPPYGGSLFEPDRFPFLEGRAPGTTWTDPIQAAAAPLAIDDRTVLDLLRSLQELEVAGSGGAERRSVSFRGLDVEQIGHVYEGLLDHTARRADALTVSLAGKHEPELAVDELERRRRKDPAGFAAWLAEETGKSQGAIEKALAYQPDKEESRRLLIACENRADVYGRVAKWAGLIRNDTKDLPVVMGEGAVYVTAGQERRSTGTHYTPKTLTEPVVRYTLEPLVYEGPAEGTPEAEWRLRSPKEILALRVCDLAMGSGAFLVQACRYLAERLVESWARAEEEAGHELVVGPDGTVSEGRSDELIIPPAHRPERSIEGPLFSRPASEPPAPPSERGRPARLHDRQRARDEERLAIARRYVADRCLYGIDKNPWAVEMAKLSLWLVTLQKDRPFTFVDHALVCGDSLLGLGSIDQLLAFHPDPRRGRQLHRLFAPEKVVRAALKRASEAREKVTKLATTSIVVAWDKAFLTREAREATADLSLLGDLLMGAALASNGKAKELDRLVLDLAEDAMRLLPETVGQRDDEAAAKRRAQVRERLRVKARELLDQNRGAQHAARSTLHWPLVFPEIVDGGGFDAFVGNPPFQGGKMISGALGVDYREHVVNNIGGGRKGHADLCAYLFLRAAQQTRRRGMLGLLATNTIAQGDTREVGLDALVASGFAISRAIPTMKWPGDANLEIASVWLYNGNWSAAAYLNDRALAGGLTSHLAASGRTAGRPQRLVRNSGKSFIGSFVLGMGFAIAPEEALELQAQRPSSADVLFPFLGGQDFNSDPHHAASRWIINFSDFPLDRQAAPVAYSGPVAADYPECLAIVRARVKPDRDALATKSDSSAKGYARLWWQFGRRAEGLYGALARVPRALVCVLHTPHLSFAFVRARHVFSHGVAVAALAQSAHLAILQSVLHVEWARWQGSTLGVHLRYTPSDCFETFPFPRDVALLDGIGERYHAHRAEVMSRNAQGLTKTYNRFHDPDERDRSIQTLRELHSEMDQAVLAAYGWTDLALDHGFHTTKQGVRFTVSEAARVEILDRLLELNHQRYAEEVAAGLHEKGAKGAKAKGKAAPAAAAKSTKGASAGNAQAAGKKEKPQLGLFTPPPVTARRPEPEEGESAEPEVALSREAKRVLKVLEKAGEPLGKAAILEQAKLEEADWRPTITELLETGRVTQEGERRGARYAVA